jgi:hypothetical protein
MHTSDFRKLGKSQNPKGNIAKINAITMSAPDNDSNITANIEFVF